MATGWTVRGSNLGGGGGGIFRTRPDRPCGPTSLLYNGYRIFPGGKERLGRDADPSNPSSAVVKKVLNGMLMTNAGVKTFVYVMVFPIGTGTLLRTVILLCFGVCSRRLNYAQCLGPYLFLAYIEQLELFLFFTLLYFFEPIFKSAH